VANWFKRWRHWLTRKLPWPLQRLGGPEVRSIQFGYEKAGLVVHNEPVPWNAEAVFVEASVVFPPKTVWRKSDFQLRLQGRPPFIPISIQPGDEEQDVKILFRFVPPQCETSAKLYAHTSLFGQVWIPFLPLEQFLANLHLECPTIYALLGENCVACQIFVEGQCQNVSACGLLTSPTSLLPIADLNFTVEFTEHGDYTDSVRVLLTATQLTAKQAFLSIVPPGARRPFRKCSVSWQLGDRSLALATIRSVPMAALHRSLRLLESRYLFQESHGGIVLSHHLPPREGAGRLMPCFLITSKEPGLAAICSLEVRVQFREPERPPLYLHQDVLVTDGPSLCIPATVSMDNLQEICSFELLCGEEVLAVLPVRPTPVASFTTEGGFKGLEEYDWTPFTEEELVDRLQRLMVTFQEEKTLDSSSPV
jgi:hypothetical protein